MKLTKAQYHEALRWQSWVNDPFRMPTIPNHTTLDLNLISNQGRSQIIYTGAAVFAWAVSVLDGGPVQPENATNWARKDVKRLLQMLIQND